MRAKKRWIKVYNVTLWEKVSFLLSRTLKNGLSLSLSSSLPWKEFLYCYAQKEANEKRGGCPSGLGSSAVTFNALFIPSEHARAFLYVR